MAALVLTEDEVRELVRQEVARALGGLRSTPDVLTTEQAAELSGVTPKTIRAWVAAGLQAEHRGRRLRIRREHLDAWRAGSAPKAATVLRSLTPPKP